MVAGELSIGNGCDESAAIRPGEASSLAAGPRFVVLTRQVDLMQGAMAGSETGDEDAFTADVELVLTGERLQTA